MREAIALKMSVHRAKVNEFIRSLGFDPNEVSHVEITPRAIFLTSYLRENSGQIYTIREGTNVRVATETRHVDITDEDAELVE